MSTNRKGAAFATPFLVHPGIMILAGFHIVNAECETLAGKKTDELVKSDEGHEDGKGKITVDCRPVGVSNGHSGDPLRIDVCMTAMLR